MESMEFKNDQSVRFTRTSKYSWEYKKGDTGIVIGRPGENIYLVKSKDQIFWTTPEDIESWDQLSLPV